LKQNRADTDYNAIPSDQSTESSVDRSPAQEVAEPQFYGDIFSALLSSPFASNEFYMNVGEAGNYFQEPCPPLEGSFFTGSGVSDFTVDPGFLWEQL
jgi:hypothetical protein